MKIFNQQLPQLPYSICYPQIKNPETHSLASPNDLDFMNSNMILHLSAHTQACNHKAATFIPTEEPSKPYTNAPLHYFSKRKYEVKLESGTDEDKTVNPETMYEKI